MYYLDPHEIISSLVTPLLDKSKRAREYVVEISLDDAPVPVVRRLSVPSNLYVGHFVYCLVYAMGWDGHHLTGLTQGETLWRSTKEKAKELARWMIVAAFPATRISFASSRIRKIPITIGSAPSSTKTLTLPTSTSAPSAAASTIMNARLARCCTGSMNDSRHARL